MTTIAADFRAGVMVCDSKCSYGDAWFPTTKIYRIGDELIGCSGDTKDEGKYLKWVRGGRRGPTPKMENLGALCMRPSGLFLITAGSGELLIERGFHAVGSGGYAATAVLIAGLSAKQAVEIACQVDCHSGGDICVFNFKEA